MRIRSARSAVGSALLVAVAACGGGGDESTGPTPSFTMSISPSTLSLEPGASGNITLARPAADGASAIALAATTGNVTVSIVRSGGFEGAVTVTVEGLPSGVTAGSATIAAGATSASLTFTASGSATATTTSVTIRGSATGLTARTATLSLTVTPPPSIALSLSPASLAIEQGQSLQSTATITRNGGFAGGVTLSASGQPALMSVQFNPATATGATSTITVGVGPGVATGTYPVTITASGTGVANATAILTVTVTQAVTPGISIAASPNAITVQAGQAGNSTLNITRTNFTGTVNLTSSGAPAGMTVAYNPAAATGNSSAITVTVGAGVTPGTYVITMTGTGTGVPTANNDFSVTVTAAPPPASIALGVSPTSLSIVQGNADNATVTITRTNFTGNVTLTATGAPANMNVGFTPSSTTGTTSTVSVTVGGSVAPGTYPITLRANGTGVSEATVQLSVTVTAVGGGGNVTFTFCAQSGIPLWFAYQNLGGAWTQVAGAGGVYQFTINPRGVVAWVMDAGGGKTSLEVSYGSTTDLNGRGAGFCKGTGASKTLTGSVSNLGGGEIAQILMGGSSATVIGALPGPFMLNNVADATLDLVATRSTLGASPNSVLFMRNLNPPNNTNLGVLDLSTGVPPTLQTGTLTNLGADQALISAVFLTKNGTGVPMSAVLPTASASQMWRGIPSGSTVPGDWHLQAATATPNGSVSGYPFRQVVQFNQTAADRTYNLPDYLTTPPSVTVAGTVPYVTVNSSWTIQSSDYNDYWSMTLVPASGTVSSVLITGSEGYFGSGPVQLNLPAFGAGFNAAWGMQPGITVNWYFNANGGPAWSNGFTYTIAEGATAFSAGVTGSFVP